MADNALISYFGPDRPGLVAAVSNRLYELGGNLADATFAALGEGAELTMVCEMPKDLTVEKLEEEVKALPALEGGEIKVRPFELKTMHGPSSRITHRLIISGGDRPGLVAKITRILDDRGANIVRMNSEKLQGASGNQYISRFAVSMREEKAPDCLAAVASLAGELKLTFRYETA